MVVLDIFDQVFHQYFDKYFLKAVTPAASVFWPLPANSHLLQNGLFFAWYESYTDKRPHPGFKHSTLGIGVPNRCGSQSKANSNSREWKE